MATDETDASREFMQEDTTELSSDESVGTAVVTITSSRTLAEDEPGDAIVSAFESEGHELATRELIDPGYDNVQSILSRLVDRNDVDIIVTVGGTGIEPSAPTLEAVDPLIDKELSAFSDLFTHLCYEEVGVGVLCARARGGIVNGVGVFCLPDDVAATRLAAESIIVPQATQLVARAGANGASKSDDE